MKILLTGATGYIGKRLLPLLVQEGHDVVVLVRDKKRFLSDLEVEVVEADLLDPSSIQAIPKEIDVAYYLVHSMAHSYNDFHRLEAESAENFVEALKGTQVKQVIYLSGIASDPKLSRHLASRKNVEEILASSGIPYTIFRAGIILGSGSASFEIIRDLVEKLPVMIAPKWVSNRTQPIAIYDVLYYLSHAINQPKCLNQVFDIGGDEVLTYKQVLLRFAALRGLKRWIISVPVLTPRLSSYWLYFVTSTNFSLAMSLVDSLKNHAVCRDFRIRDVIPHQTLSFDQAVERAFLKIDQNAVISSWKDSWVTSEISQGLSSYIETPHHGCFKDIKRFPFHADKRKEVVERIWNIGGATGWYAYDWAWKLRGFVDKVFGGVGLNRGRTHPSTINAGDSLDFWRVLYANKEEGRLLLYAEMKLPGEAWLEFKIEGSTLVQTATFRPSGVLGRLYWYTLYPIHTAIFLAMGYRIASL